MLFNSFQFLIFFPIVTAAYFALPHSRRWPLLIIASCYFYMVLVPEYILILFFLILVDYTAGLLLERSTGRRRKAILVLSLVANIGTLALFKYINFFNANIGGVLHLLGWHYTPLRLGLALPIGLSFHTFQSMSYTIEVYRGRYKAEHHLGLYALYVLFYPQMVAGPIERPGHLLVQFHEKKSFDYQRIADGLKLMAWGLLKKVVIADRLAVIVSSVYDHLPGYSGLPLAVATYAFSFQIYCDFSGYSDIAIGAARVMGFSLMKNFDHPYRSQSINEFWKRWHISLSSWFRDYLYIPLGGNRVSIPRWYLNLFIVFLVSGLWHGANWTFVVWGGLHGFYLVFSIVTEKVRTELVSLAGLDRRPGLLRAIRVLVTFHLVTFSWIFFRAASLKDAWYVIRNILRSPAAGLNWNLGLSPYELGVAGISVILLEIVQYVHRQYPILPRLRPQPAPVRWAFYASAIAVIVIFGRFTSLNFIYFQF